MMKPTSGTIIGAKNLWLDRSQTIGESILYCSAIRYSIKLTSDGLLLHLRMSPLLYPHQRNFFLQQMMIITETLQLVKVWRLKLNNDQP